MYFNVMRRTVLQFQVDVGDTGKKWKRGRRGEREVKHWQHTAVGFLHRGLCYTLVVISLTNNLPGGLSVRT